MSFLYYFLLIPIIFLYPSIIYFIVGLFVVFFEYIINKLNIVNIPLFITTVLSLIIFFISIYFFSYVL